MVALLLRDEASGSAWRVWPDSEAVPPGRVHETGSYLFELHDSTAADADAGLLIDEVLLEGLRPGTGAVARWRWSPGFHAGTVEAELRLPGSRPRRFEIITDPDRRKLTRDDFDAMVREILEDSFALFSLSGFRKSVARGTGDRPPAIARLEFLRSRITELEDVVQSIARTPRRILSAEDRLLPYHRAVRATGPEILRSLRSGRLSAERHGGPSRLPAALRGILPEQIRVRARRSSLDLREHRQMGACLRAWASWLTSAAGLLSRSSVPDDTDLRRSQGIWAARCRRLARRIGGLAGLPPFAEAGDAPPALTLSSVFRHDPAYRRFFRLYQDINLGIAAVFGEFLGMPLARTFDLYELWCFLRLVRAGAEEFGAAGLEIRDLFIADPAGSVTFATGAVMVPVGRGWKLCFQKQYQEFWKAPDGRGSFSRIMVPDVVIGQDSIPGGEIARLIVLDAKYRIEDGLPAALNSIHTYRDALVHEAEGGKPEGIVTAAYLLAPHIPLDLVPQYRDTPLPGRLFHPEYRRSFRFGAVTLRPGMAAADVAQALRDIVADATTA
jgi:Domain of unknown function (DUF2357)/PD-(D/E)XK nuclease superfamily